MDFYFIIINFFFSVVDRSQYPKAWKLVYSPKNAILDKLLIEVIDLLKLDGFEGVRSAEEVEKTVRERDFLAGILFDQSTDIEELPKNLSYTLRFPSECRLNNQGAQIVSIYNWQTNLLYPLESGGGPNGWDEPFGGVPIYGAEGFLPIQNAIARTFIQFKCNGTIQCDGIAPNIEMQRYPYPPFTVDLLLDALEIALPLFIMLAYAYSIISTVRLIGMEKERQLKEVMKIMGMPVWLHWTSWFFRSIIFLLISNLLMVALFKVKQLKLSFSYF